MTATTADRPKRYALAPNGVFVTCQGEGALMGVPTVFVRLAGCSVGCPGCDTLYRVAERVGQADLVNDCLVAKTAACQWAWVTGGEPTDQDVLPLVHALQDAGFRVALATAGVRPVREGRRRGGVDFLSVSPHTWGPGWVQRAGTQLNVVPGLNGLKLAVVPDLPRDAFPYRYVTPLYGSAESLAECVAFVQAHPGWRLGVQAHKVWGLP